MRTLYKHVGSKTGLITAVLDQRRARFFAHMEASAAPGDPTVDTLFDALRTWLESEGARGCLFLRAAGEGAVTTPEVSGTVTRYHTELHQLMNRIILAESGFHDPESAEQLLVVFEGATAAFTYRGAAAIDAAHRAALGLVRP